MQCFRTAETARVAGPAPRGHSQRIHQLPRTLRKMAAFGTISVAAVLSACGNSGSMQDNSAANAAAANAALVAQGKQIFRFDTFGDESKWTDVLGLQTTITNIVTPAVALSVGLKVDADALPASVVQGIQNGTIPLDSTTTTIALLKLNAVVGLKGTVENIAGTDTLTHVGVTCALCHSTVQNVIAAGIPAGVGTRLDGWPNLDLNPGAIIALTSNPAVTVAQKAVFNSWGKGKYDPRFNLDGLNGPQVIPPAYGLAGINSITVTGDGTDVAYWNRYVGVTQMGGHGTFVEPRTGVNVNNGADANGAADLITAKLPALQAYQLSLSAPPPPAGIFDPADPVAAAAAARGKLLFNGVGGCSTCHSGPLMTDAPTLHLPSEVVSEPEPSILTAGVLVAVPSYASRSATGKYRTSPLHGLWQHAPYFHNGSAATLLDVVNMYNTRKALGLSVTEVADLAEYLKSL
jgi:cytochrome c553